jgi:hypothetical protein
MGFADAEFKNWSGARDLNPGPSLAVAFSHRLVIRDDNLSARS